MVNKGESQIRKTEPRFFYGYIIVIAAFITQVMMFGPRSSFGVFFKPLIAEFGWTRALTSGAYSISALVQGLSGIFMGNLNDRLGPRIVMTFCGLLLGLGFILMSLTSAAWHLYLFYVVLIGIGMGGIFAPPMSTVARWFFKGRSVVTGIVLAGGGVGQLIVPPVVNWLIEVYGWRNSYIIVGAMILIIIILTAQFLKRDPPQMGQLPYGTIKDVEQRLDLNTEGLSLGEAINTKQFWMVVPMLFCFALCLITMIVHIVPHATDLGISAATAANILAVMGGGVLIGGIVLGSVADRIGNMPAIIVCFILLSAALFWLLPAKEVWKLYLFAVVFGFGGGGIAALQSPLVADLFGMRSHGLILGVVISCNAVGTAIGPFMAGYIFDVSSSYQLAFLLLAAISIVGLILSATLRPTRKLGSGV